MTAYLKPGEMNDLFTVENTMGKGKKNPNNLVKRRINPICLPSHPPVYDVESWLFSGIRKDGKQAEVFLGRGSKLIG